VAEVGLAEEAASRVCCAVVEVGSMVGGVGFTGLVVVEVEVSFESATPVDSILGVGSVGFDSAIPADSVEGVGSVGLEVNSALVESNIPVLTHLYLQGGEHECLRLLQQIKSADKHQTYQDFPYHTVLPSPRLPSHH